jgi:hypothetical protein
MSTTGSVVSSTAANYSVPVAGTSSFRQDLKSLGNAIDKGDLGAAATLLKRVTKPPPAKEAGTASSSAAKTATDKAFQNLAEAILSNKADAVRAAWKEIYLGLNSDQVGASSISVSAPAALASTKALSSLPKEASATTPGHPVAGQGTPAEQLIGSSLAGTSPAGSRGTVSAGQVLYEPGGQTKPEPSATPVETVLNTVA